MLPPDDFISIAERSGLIGSLTNFVLRRAIAQCRSWHARGWDLNVAVNLSVVGLIDLDLPESIDGMLRVAGLDPKYLTLEITESSIMDTGRTVAAIDRLGASVSGSRSTTSAPATRRCRTCRSCRCTRSRSTSRS